MMHPSSRFSLALVLSLALWWPTFQTTMRGDLDPLDASLRWVGAFVVASIGVRVVGSLLDAYATPAEQRTPARGDADHQT